MRAIANRHPLALYGRGWKAALGRRARCRHIYPRHYRAICASTKIFIGIDKRDDLDLYFSSRTWLTLGCDYVRAYHTYRHATAEIVDAVFENPRP